MKAPATRPTLNLENRFRNALLLLLDVPDAQ
jgi:hypothetical protein